MPIENNNGTITITGDEDIAFARTLALRGALSLECKGMKRHGRSAYAIVKEEFGFKGCKKRVLAQLENHILELKEQRNADTRSESN